MNPRLLYRRIRWRVASWRYRRKGWPAGVRPPTVDEFDKMLREYFVPIIMPTRDSEERDEIARTAAYLDRQGRVYTQVTVEALVARRIAEWLRALP